jgi:hypothetical protein
VYNANVARSQHLPKTERLSVLAATILLTYTITRFVDFPTRTISLQLPGIYLAIQLNVRTVIAILVAGLSATGANWLLSDHPLSLGKSTIQHWLLPALTAWVIGLPLYQIPMSARWLISFIIGGGLLILVLVAEYLVIDPNDVRHTPAAIGLISISYALFFMLTVWLRTTEVRLFLLIPILTFTMLLVSLRTLQLRLHRSWAFVPAFIITLIIGELTTTLHYLPLQPITFGLVLLGPAYALTSLMVGFLKAKPLRQIAVEPLIVIIVVWITAVWSR